MKFRPDNPLSDDGISYWTKTLSQNNFKGYNSLPNQFCDITHIDVFKGTNVIVNAGMTAAYFLFENLTSDLIGKCF